MCSPVNPICDVSTVLGTVGGKVAGSVFNQIAKAFASAAKSVTDWMWTVIAKTTTVDLGGSWFRSTLGITVTLAGLVITALFVLELIKAALKHEPGAIGRAVVGVGVGLLGAAASVGVVSALLTATDALSGGVVKTVGLDGIGQLGKEIAPTAALYSLNSPALMLILGLGYLLASFFVWALFIIRKAMLIVAAVFAPIAFAGAPMQVTSSWVRKWIEFTVAMVFSKLVIVILFTLAVSLVGSPGRGMAAVGNLFSGLAMLVIACFAPWFLFRLVHFVGGDVMAAHHQGTVASAIEAGSTPVTLARSGAMHIAGIVGGGANGLSPQPKTGMQQQAGGSPGNDAHRLTVNHGSGDDPRTLAAGRNEHSHGHNSGRQSPQPPQARGSDEQ